MQAASGPASSSSSSSTADEKMLERKHFPTREDISEIQLEKIAELRSRLHDQLHAYPDYNTDFQLLRWLYGWEYDVDAIVPKLRRVLEAFVALRIHELPFMKPEEINAFAHTQSKAAEYFPGGLMGVDHEGNLIVLEAMARVHPKTLCLSGPCSELFVTSMVVGETAQRWLRHREEIEGRKLGAKLIMDLDGFSMDLLYRPTLKVYMNQLSLLQMCFPDLVRAIYIINCPAMIHVAYSLIQPVLAKQTRDKIHFLGSDWKMKVIEEFGPENIYPQWGGTKVAANGKPSGDLRMGGRVPEHLWYRKEDNPFDNNEGFTTLNVAARTKRELKVVAVKGETIRWLFRVNSGDIDFSIMHEDVPVSLFKAEQVLQIGSIIAPADGDYFFVFDNTYGKIWSKDITVKVTAVDTESKF